MTWYYVHCTQLISDGEAAKSWFDQEVAEITDLLYSINDTSANELSGTEVVHLSVAAAV